MKWHPPSDILEWQEGIWTVPRISSVSYPDEGNNTCLQVEEGSYWFAHRNQVILEAVSRFPPSGTIYDVGGGNGFVSLALQKVGLDVVLLEPGLGAYTALKRGVQNVVRATLQDADFATASISAVCLFDVLEHIDQEIDCLREIRRVLKPEGLLFCTVPGHAWLWSKEDIAAGHFRRYSRSSIKSSMEVSGFNVEYVSHFFSYLPLPIWFVRVLPSLFRIDADSIEATNNHHHHSLPLYLRPVVRICHWLERSFVSRRRSLPSGSSLLCIAKAS